MKIGELARAAGLSVPTVRFYESEGLLAPAARTASGYRVFAAADLERTQFIKKAQRLGLSLQEIRDVLAIRDRNEPTCEHVRALLAQRVADINQVLADLTELRDQLARLLSESEAVVDCHPLGGRVCGIIEHAPVADGRSAGPSLPPRRAGRTRVREGGPRA